MPKFSKRAGAMAIAACALAGCFWAGGALAAPGDLIVSQVADVNPGINGSSPGDYTVVGGDAYFAATDATNGDELWRTNGGPLGAGTQLADDINPTGSSQPRDLINIGGVLYFSATDGVHGRELWKKAPGSAAVMVQNVNTGGGMNGPDSSDPEDFVNANGTLLFSAANGSGPNGRELWKSDGATATLVDDINGGGNGFIDGLTLASDGTALFRGRDSGVDNELWKSVPPYSSASLVENINTDAGAGSEPLELTAVGDSVFFEARDAAAANHQSELWGIAPPFTDATLIQDIRPGAMCSCPDDFTAVGSTLFLAAYQSDADGYELWKLPAPYTAGSATRVADINTGGGSDPEDLANAGGTLYFSATDGAAHGREVWTSDGTSATRVSEIGAGGLGSDPDEFTPFMGKVYFSAYTDAGMGVDNELYGTDGSLASTTRVADINPGLGSSFPFDLTVLGDKLLFSAEDPDGGEEPWKLAPEPSSPPLPGPGTTSTAPVSTATGQRAAALKKCKKKKSKKAKKRCKKKAKKLPL